MAFDFDYATEAEIRNQGQGVESDDLSTAEIEKIADQFGHELHRELKRTTQFTNDGQEWHVAKTYVVCKSGAYILLQYKEAGADAERLEKIAEKALNTLKKRGKVSKTSGMNNYA